MLSQVYFFNLVEKKFFSVAKTLRLMSIKLL